GIVPHAGWVFSGATAGQVFAFLKKHSSPSTFIFYGAVHHFMGNAGVIMDSGTWVTPLGDVQIDEQLAAEMMSGVEGLSASIYSHEGEHSIEVNVPFIRSLFPEAKLVPVLVPPTEDAARIGREIGRIIAGREDIVALGSTDLTHYGPRYGFAPKGTGQAAHDWVKNVNDRRVIDLAVGMKAEQVVEDAALYQNTCGAGAIAATVATARECGKEKGILLDYTTSHEVMPQGAPSMFVGYAGIVF
ncbi:MAG TPA: AmmeMemoRadiSam system protein B, partial [bacterium]|nr:AmmeMemoRadiSam system protein B [bacterium]